MRITYYGHSCFLVQTNGKTLIIDPFISPNEQASSIDVSEIRCDYMILTHGHGDHIADVMNIAKNNPEMVLISNYEIVTHYADKGIQGHGMNHGGKFNFDFGTIKLVNAVHSSSFPDGSYAGNPAGIVIWNDEGVLYHAGDTALTRDMELIPISCPALSAAILPIGDNFTMDYQEALIASDMIDCDFVIGCHFDTFPPIKVDHNKVEAYFNNAEKQIVLPTIGQTIDI